MVSVFLLEFKRNMRDKGLLFWMIILPIIFTVLFIGIFTTGMSELEKEQVVISIIPGYAVMFVFFIMISMTSSFLKDNYMGMIARVASSPLSSNKYLLGKWFSFMLIVWVQILILFIFGKVIYHIPLNQFIFIFIISVFLSFTTTGIGLALAMFAKTENMGIAITQVITLGGAVLGGLWMPLETMPDFLQKFAPFLPQYWAHQAFKQSMNGTLPFKELFVSLFVLFIFGLGGFIFAVLRYPNFLQRARH